MHRWWQEDRPGWTERAWWEATLHEPVRALLWLEPGPALVAALADLGPMPACAVDHDADRVLGSWPVPGSQPGWPCACQVIRAAAWEACASWASIGAASALVDAAGPEPVDHAIAGGRRVVRDPAREELAHALRTSLPAMANRIDAARAVAASPTLVEQVRSGTISSWAARLITQHVNDLPDEDAQRVIADVCHRIGQRLASGRRPWHSAEINRLARATRMRLCPQTEREARVRAQAARRVCVQPGTDGMATLIADLDATDAHRIHRRLSAIAGGLQATAAEAGEPENRTRDQLRADILVDVLLGYAPTTTGIGTEPGSGSATGPGSGSATGPGSGSATGPGSGSATGPGSGTGPGSAPFGPVPPSGKAGGAPEVQVIVTLATLVGLTDEPAEVPGVGPVPADVARALAADGRWRAWIADAAGAITATGGATYVPSPAVARLVRAREPRCRFPGCHQPATRCDLDHAIPWPRGATEPTNLGPLCRRHHTLKTHGAWRLVPDGPEGQGEPVGPVGLGPPVGPASIELPVTSPGWTWRTPAGLTVTDGPQSPLGAAAGTPPAGLPAGPRAAGAPPAGLPAGPRAAGAPPAGLPHPCGRAPTEVDPVPITSPRRRC